MAERLHHMPLRSGSFLWGPIRVRLGWSLRDLEEASGMYRGFLSRCENGVMIPTGEEFGKVMVALASRARELGVPLVEDAV